jgi:hypothetical protein
MCVGAATGSTGGGGWTARGEVRRHGGLAWGDGSNTHESAVSLVRYQVEFGATSDVLLKYLGVAIRLVASRLSTTASSLSIRRRRQNYVQSTWIRNTAQEPSTRLITKVVDQVLSICTCRAGVSGETV